MAILLASAVVAVSAMIHGAGKFEWSWFYPWVIGPYGILLLVFCLPMRQSDARSIAGRIAAALVLTVVPRLSRMVLPPTLMRA